MPRIGRLSVLGLPAYVRNLAVSLLRAEKRREVFTAGDQAEELITAQKLKHALEPRGLSTEATKKIVDFRR